MWIISWAMASSSTVEETPPFQARSSLSRSLSLVIHLLGITSFSLSYKYLVDYPTFVNDSYGWHWQYLTVLGLAVAFATYTFGLLADITLSPAFFIIKNTLSLCSTPLEVLVSVLYWSISLVDRGLVVPPGANIAPYADLGFHLMPALFLTVDLLLLSPPWTIKLSPAIGLSSVIAVGYWAWSEQCYRHNG